ncbi:type IX secretion system membrane protein, PorP/SprF family [Chitinophaga sp. CF118]|uniref:PorP/SprF family type IX secretion system membrane protein n=1 Tax=Chitinophaga sp. CF118 TaxID=1884367 RepID=UPI0008E94E90|nr:type IX secretion system membrane protein PorP/SprF [Chitinophaga sp. CF118]SFD74480.1 type IX secretion system membrane protein, PorP/SprF family [Chitinophaga sp. CF118]
MHKCFTNITLLLIFMFSFLSAYSQQDAQFSQYMFNGLYINPAYAGYREQWNINMFYRTQWAGLPGAPKTFSVAADGAVNDNRVGLGLQVVSDQLGAEKNTAMYGSYAYRIHMDDDGNRTLAIGIGAGFIQQKLNTEALSPASQSDALLMNAKKTAFMPDARVGIFYNSERIYTGLSADNLITRAFQKSDKLRTYLPLKPHLYFTVGGLIPLSNEVLLKPSLLVKEDFAGPTSVDLNAFFLFSKVIWLGGSYRTAVLNKNDISNSVPKAGALVAMMEVFVNSKLRIGYAYDKTVNGTGATSYATHEISLNYFFENRKARMLSPRYF